MITLLSVCGLILQTVFFLKWEERWRKAENAWRKCENDLVDKILKREDTWREREDAWRKQLMQECERSFEDIQRKREQDIERERNLEDEWRKRERDLVDRLLKQANVKPLQIERENVVKLPDPETPSETWIDQSFFEDEIKEEIEQIYPEAAHMSHSEVKSRFAPEWMRIESRLKEQKVPLRA